MIESGRSYVVVGSCDVFFSDQGTVRIRSGLYRARQGLAGLDRAWIWDTAGQEKTKLAGTEMPLGN